MAFNGGNDAAFSDVAAYRDGTISVGYYSGNTEWERHRAGDEIVMAIEGRTTIILLAKGEQHRVELNAGDLVVVPQGYWHRFEGSEHLKVLGVTPEPTDHRLDLPDA